MKRRRTDGRLPSQLRPMSAELSTLRGTDGSCRLCTGDTLVVASVHGPRPAPARLEDAGGAALEVFVSLCSSGGVESTLGDTSANRARARSLEASLRAALAAAVARAAAPRTIVSLSVLVLHDGGGLTAAATNTAVLALADAGVPLQALLAAAQGVAPSAGANEDSQLLLDPTLEEERTASEAGRHARATFAWRGDGAEAVGMAVAAHAQGLPPDAEVTATRQLRDASATVYAFMRALLARKVEGDAAVCIAAESGSMAVAASASSKL